MAREAGRFAERIRADLGIRAELFDERLSSWEAQQSVAETAGGKSRNRNRKQQKLDELAAAVILRDYLRSGSGAS
jgi:putative transcription antitermination factor YqgF